QRALRGLVVAKAADHGVAGQVAPGQHRAMQRPLVVNQRHGFASRTAEAVRAAHRGVEGGLSLYPLARMTIRQQSYWRASTDYTGPWRRGPPPGCAPPCILPSR